MYKKISKFMQTGDADFGEIIKHSVWAFIMLGLASVIQFIFDLLLARSFGAEGTGLFYLAFSVLIIGSLVGRLGLNKAVVRYIPTFVEKNEWDRVVGLKRTSTQLSLMLSIPISVAVLIAASLIAEGLFQQPQVTNYLRWFSVAIPLFSLVYVQAGFLRGLKLIKESMIIERISYFLIAIIFSLFLGKTIGLDSVVVGFVAGLFISVILGELLISKSLPSTNTVKLFDKKTLLLLAAPLLLVEFSNQLSGQINVVILGALKSPELVGIFNVAVKVSLLVGVLLTGINSIVATKIAELHNKGDYEKLATVISKTAGFALLCGTPFILLFFLFPELVLGLFGSEFTEGALVLRVLLIGQLVNLAVGSVTYILAMTGHEKVLAVTITSCSLILNALLSLWLIPLYGVVGAGIAISTSVIVKNIVQLILVKRYLNIWSLPFKALRGWMFGSHG